MTAGYARAVEEMRRYRALSTPVVAIMAVSALAIVLFEDATNGRIWSLLAILGVVAVIDGVRSLRRRDLSPSRWESEVERPLRGIGAIAAGVVFVVLGVLVAAGITDIG